MAYVRWSPHSNWYIFWHTSDARRKEDELLAIWHVKDERAPLFTYRELEGIKTVEQLKDLLGLDIPDEEYEEALKYIEEWREDVEREYKKKEGS